MKAVRNSEFGIRNSRAFTLVELVVGSAIMTLILAASYVCLSAGMASRKTAESRSEIIQNARVAMSLITADLRTATPLSREAQFVGMQRKLGEAQADNLDFATHHYTPQRQHEGDFCEMSYFVQPEPGFDLFSLWRRRDTSPDQEPMSGGSREQVCRGLKGVRFEYYDGLDWYDEWGDPEGRYKGQKDPLLLPNNVSGMPDAVRVTLFLAPEPKAVSKARSTGGKAAGTEIKTEEPPPMVFQTVVRLELAAIAASRSYGGSGGEGGDANGATTTTTGANSGRSPAP